MYISFEDFKKLDLRVAEIIEAEKVEGSEKLVKLRIDLGNNEIRQIIAGIGKTYNPEDLIGRQIVVVANLEPRIFTLRSDSGQVELESQGMLLAASSNDSPVLLVLDRDVELGSTVS